jgi:hypothetical protein
LLVLIPAIGLYALILVVVFRRRPTSTKPIRSRRPAMG